MKYIVALAAVAALVYFFYRRGKEEQAPKSDPKKFTVGPKNTEVIEGEAKMTDIIGYFRCQNLDPKKHTPFIANWNDPEIRGMVEGEAKEGYEALFVGVYNEESEDIEVWKVFFAKSFDQAIKDALGDNTLVVLS